jgi:Zn-dependent peptidase ImmA (M78 family)/DNA-binding XRE family transcriptional regulator
MFNPARLILARERRGFTKKDLADKLGLSTRTLIEYERGRTTPSPESLQLLSTSLGFPASFFSSASPLRPETSAVSFRAMRALTAAQRDRAIGAAAIGCELSKWLEARFELPSPTVPTIRDDTAAAAADAIRSAWRLGERPVRNMVDLLEVMGVRVFSLGPDCARVDAFSFWLGDVPYVFLNTAKSAEHGRFDAAHELGHLVLHRHAGPQGRDAEREADRFASALLMPEGDVRALTPSFVDLAAIVKLKTRWRVSVAALNYRLHSLGLTTEWQYRTLCIELARRGWRTAEPEPISRETSQLLRKSLHTMRMEGVGLADIAADLCVSQTELEELTFGLVPRHIPGEAQSASSAAPRRDFRLVRPGPLDPIQFDG